jgi:signal transduction histidine kinase
MRPGVEEFGLIEVFQKVWETGDPASHSITLYRDERLTGWYENFVYKLPSGEIVAVFDNITGRKQTEEALAAKHKEMESYLYATSHDLRSPLVNIQGFSQRLQKQTGAIKKMLSEYPPEPEIKQKIEKITDQGIPNSLDFILTNVSKMDTLINGLLKISRTGRVKMAIQKGYKWSAWYYVTCVDSGLDWFSLRMLRKKLRVL